MVRNCWACRSGRDHSRLLICVREVPEAEEAVLVLMKVEEAVVLVQVGDCGSG